MNILGIYREYEEAGKPKEDRAIASLVGEMLRDKGHNVKMIDGEEISKIEKERPDLIFSMARRQTTLDLLCKKEKTIPIINSPRAVKLCLNRQEVYNIMKEENIPFPDTHEVLLDDIKEEFPFVLKKTDSHGKLGDTFIVRSSGELKSAINSLRASGTNKILLQVFVDGHVNKYYGIGNEVFFPNFIETKNFERVKKYVIRLSRAVGLDVFGGDFIYTQKGEIYIIDFNDWPSFSPMKEEAAKKIAKLIDSMLKVR